MHWQTTVPATSVLLTIEEYTLYNTVLCQSLYTTYTTLNHATPSIISTMSTAREQQYWLPGFGLSRHIVLGHIQYFLGPNASARPFTYQVMNGTP
jgi:hypothetical protein